jgi:hypothetical protein
VLVPCPPLLSCRCVPPSAALCCYAHTQSACVQMPRTKVPLSLTCNKLMAPQQGIGGILQLPVRVAGLPLTAAAAGGDTLLHGVGGACVCTLGPDRNCQPAALTPVLH